MSSRAKKQDRVTVLKREAVDTLSALAREFPGVAHYRYELAETLMQRPPQPRRGAKPDEQLLKLLKQAAADYRRGLPIAKKLFFTHSRVPEYRSSYSRAMQQAYWLYRSLDDRKALVQLWRDIVGYRVKTLELEGVSKKGNRGVLYARRELVHTLYWAGQKTEGKRELDSLLREAQKALAGEDLLFFYSRVANMLRAAGEREEARTVSSRAEALRKR